MPQFVVRKGEETANTITIFSFDLEAIRESRNISGEDSLDAFNRLGLVATNNYRKNQELGILDPWKMKNLAVCPHWEMMSYSPPNSIEQALDGEGFIKTNLSDGDLFTKRFSDIEEIDLAPAVCVNDKFVLMTTSKADLQGEAISAMVDNGDTGVGEYDAVREVLSYLPKSQMVAFVFPFNSYSFQAESGSISGGLSIIDYQKDIESFKSWGRPEGLRICAFGVNIEKNYEHVVVALLYPDEEAAEGDLESLERAASNVPSIINGRKWFDMMRFGKPIIRRDGTANILEFDITNRKSGDGFVSSLMLETMDKMRDWGIMWKQ